MPIANSRDALLQELGVAHAMETQLLEVHEEVLEQTSNAQIRGALKMHGGQTERHIDNIESCFAELGEEPAGDCQTIRTLIEEGRTNMAEAENPAALDVALTSAVIKGEFYEIATYNVLLPMAESAGLDRIAQLLRANLIEDQAAAALAQGVQPQVIRAARAVE